MPRMWIFLKKRNYISPKVYSFWTITTGTPHFPSASFVAILSHYLTKEPPAFVLVWVVFNTRNPQVTVPLEFSTHLCFPQSLPALALPLRASPFPSRRHALKKNTGRLISKECFTFHVLQRAAAAAALNNGTLFAEFVTMRFEQLISCNLILV